MSILGNDRNVVEGAVADRSVGERVIDPWVAAYFLMLLLVSGCYGISIHEVYHYLFYTLNADTFRFLFQLGFGLIVAPYIFYFKGLKPTALARTKDLPTDRFISIRDLKIVGQRGRLVDIQLTEYWGIANFFMFH